jgi:hypothetical protein
MEKITKKEFKELYQNLALLQGMVFLSKEVLIEKLNVTSEETIKQHCKPVSNYGDISTDKEGLQTTNIFQSGPFIFVELIFDLSKDRYTSRNEIEIYNTIYYKG